MIIARLIGQPAIDFQQFLTGAQEALGEKLARKADETRRVVGDVEKFAICLHTLNTDDKIQPYLLDHVSLCFMVAVKGKDIDDFRNRLGALSSIMRETDSGLFFGVISGTYNQFADACKSNDWPDIERQLRQLLPRESQCLLR